LNYDREKTCRLRDAILAGEEKKVIGISWKTQSLSPGSGNRNIKLTDLAQILDHANIRLVCLQYGDVDDELKALQRDLGIEIMQVSEVDNMNDIDGLASLIMACDQVVSTTNVTVHLAGALGANTKALLPFSTRWIWGSSGSDSFWYDTVLPYRQNNAGDWSNVFRSLV
jgi:ADP-heptose:LPS heptosyltransferase